MPELDEFKTKLWRLFVQAELSSRIDTDEEKHVMIDAAGDAFAAGVKLVKAIWKS